MWCALTCRHRQRDPEAMQSLGGGGSGGALPQTSGKNAVCFTYPCDTLTCSDASPRTRHCLCPCVTG